MYNAIAGFIREEKFNTIAVFCHIRLQSGNKIFNPINTTLKGINLNGVVILKESLDLALVRNC